MISPLEDVSDDSSRKLLHSYDVEKHAEEKQRAEVDKLSALPSCNVDSEPMVSTKQKLVALLGYFLCNIGLTVYNKAVLGKFTFPWLLTALHAAATSIGCGTMLGLGYFQTTKLSGRENLALLGFSLLYTVNIAVSNVSLAMVSVPFHQVVRGTTPLVTTMIYRFVYGRTFSSATYLSLVPIILGVSIATYGDMVYTRTGFAMTFLGVILAALKTIITNRMMTGRLALSFWELLLRMSPLACVQALIFASIQGEMAASIKLLRNGLLAAPTGATALPTPPRAPTMLVPILLGNGALAFFLNISSFRTNKIAGALTMTVCANIKQCLTIALGIVLFDATVTPTNLCGIVIALGGGAAYSFVELRSK
ncbi:hypothetical protein PMZ80_004842 [Knufia obscura]|uniref:Sugar phosphate transporter domain-containing protein n=1 Tax=Knufia obscura TaxID=1635080 RepID=A0ABR0RQC4_9EURO|nr:hypothetical protein PMZ80_004842 [Knufia obscura]